MTNPKEAGGGPKLTKAQLKALCMVQRRDWPAGEPRLSWLHQSTKDALIRQCLIVPRADSGYPGVERSTAIAELTDAGRAALSKAQPPLVGG